MNFRKFFLKLFTLGGFIFAVLVNVINPSSASSEDLIPVIYFAYLSEDNIRIEAIDLPPGQMQVVPAMTDGVMAWPILPPSHGRSAAVADPTDGGMWLVRRSDTEITLEFRRSKGDPSGWKAPVEMLAKSRIRISISGTDSQVTFEILGYADVQSSGGPVLNSLSMAGFPKAGQFVVETDTSEYKTSTNLTGTAQFRNGNLPIVDFYVDGQKVGAAIIDTGGATTLIDSSLITSDMDVKKFQAPKVSGGGEDDAVSKGPMGAGGEVEALLGNAMLSNVSVGDIQFGDIEVVVMEGLRETFEARLGEPIVAVLGLEQMVRANTITFEFGDEVGFLRLGDEVSEEGLPFTLAASHMYVSAEASGHTVSLLLDTGARANLLFSTKAAETLGIRPDPDRQTIEGVGVDGVTVSLIPSILPEFQIGHRFEQDLPVLVSDLPALASRQGMDGVTGLLGYGYLQSFSSFTLDMINERLVLKD